MPTEENDRHDEATAPHAPGDSIEGGTGTPIAELDSVVRTYGGAPALGPVSLRIDGDRVALLGPNGAGKTTLIRLLMGTLQPDSGTVKVLGQPVTAATRSRIGYLPEGDVHFPHLNGVESVVHAGRLSGLPRADAVQRAHQVLDYVELHDERYRSSASYSTGMKQRLKLAQALVHDPDLLILDEPTEGLDPAARDHLLGLVDELARTHGLRVLLSTHLLADVERLATHGVVLAQGRVAVSGGLEELRRGGTQGFAVRVAGDPAPLQRRLQEHGIACRLVGPAVHADVATARELARHVEASGLVLRDLGPVRLRLEDAFAQAVAGAAASSTADAARMPTGGAGLA
jgi:ABC-2 type transport system ATP-binding protein